MDWEVIEDRHHQGHWRVEATTSEGEVYVAIFSGPDAHARAEEYSAWKASQ